MKHYYFSTDAAATAEFDPSAAGVVEFKTLKGERLATDHQLSKSALLLLGQSWPRPIAFAELAEQALALLSSEASPGRPGDDIEALANVLFQAFRAGLVQLHREPPRLTTAISERPLASLLARRQAERTPLVTNMVHGASCWRTGPRGVSSPLSTVRGPSSSWCPTCARPGSRPADASSATAGGSPPEITRETVESHLKLLGRLGLLTA